MDEVVPTSASKNIYQKIKVISSNFCFLNEFEGYHQIDPNLMNYVNLKIKELF
jgi:phospholipase/carboxylesterase